MSILDNEGHDPQGFGNQPSWAEVHRLHAEIERLTAERDRMRAALRASESLKAGYIEGHNKLAERVGALDATLRNFADPANWYEKVGLQQWMGKRDAIDLAESVLQQFSGNDPNYCERCNTSHASIDCHNQQKADSKKT